MVRYSIDHTGPKTHPGGLNTGLFKDAYHVPVSVNNPPNAGRKPRIIKKTIFSTFIIRYADVILRVSLSRALRL